MAGDWIKVEHSTCDKPEVLRMAELLGISRRETIGILVDFWVWLDRNSSHGSVTHMSRASVDSFTHCAGFGAALADIGWAKIDETTGKLTVPKFDRHNGKSAKTRALAKDRKVTQRSRESHAKPVTREEKRREVQIRTSPPKAAKPTAVSLPSGFGISDRVREWAADKGHRRLDERLEQFVGYVRRGDKRYVDWDEAFMSAIREDWAHLGDKPEPSGRSTQVAL